ncbi:MAG: cysteine hydrolase [Desulfobacterales bacterium]|nr:cysteine hydrolase [Desulfobacterales bacterium]
MLESFQLSSANTALLVVDVQNDFCHNQGVFSKYKSATLDHVEQAVSNLSALIEKCRESNLPIIFIRTIHSDWTNSPSWLKRMEGAGEKMRICPPDSWGSNFYNVAPMEGDCIVTKHRYSAFIGTDLALILGSKGIKNILVTGVATNVCVESTARDGYHRDYNVILIEDCCGAYDNAEHAATLNNIGKFFGTVTTSETLIATLEKVSG